MTTPFLGTDPVAVYPLGGGPAPEGYEAPVFDVRTTVLSEFANSPVLMALVDFFSEWLDPAGRFEAFFDDLWNLETARGFGLDAWGRILGVSRVLQVPQGLFLGFEQADSARPFGHGILYGGGRSTNSSALTDEAYRLLLMAKAALNITDGSIGATNKVLLALFGDGYVRDNLDMTIDYVFSRSLTAVEFAIIFQSGAIPKPAGVSFTVEQP